MTDTLDINGAADYLKIHSKTMEELANCGEVFGAKIGRSWVFRKVDLDEYLYKKTREQTEERRNRIRGEAPMIDEKPPEPSLRTSRRKRRELPALPEIPGKIATA